MKSANLAVIAAIVMTIIGSGAYAYDYVLTAEQMDQNTWTYTLTNNSLNADVVDWTLHWNPNDPADDDIQAIENFDIFNGVVKPLPVAWYQIGGDFPSFGTFDMSKAIKHGGGTLGGFTIKFKIRDDQSTEPPTWFSVGYVEGGERMSSDMIPVPEPASLCSLIGLIGAALACGRRRPH